MYDDQKNQDMRRVCCRSAPGACFIPEHELAKEGRSRVEQRQEE